MFGEKPLRHQATVTRQFPDTQKPFMAVIYPHHARLQLADAADLLTLQQSARLVLIQVNGRPIAERAVRRQQEPIQSLKAFSCSPLNLRHV